MSTETAIRRAIVAIVLAQFILYSALLQPMTEVARVLVFCAGTLPCYAVYKLHEALYP